MGRLLIPFLLLYSTWGGVYQSRGDLFLRRGMYRMAVSAFMAGLKEHPDDPSLQIGLARAMEGYGRYAEALATLEANLDREPYGVREAILAARCTSRLGDRAATVYHLQDAMLLRSERTGFLFEACMLSIESGNAQLQQRFLQDYLDEVEPVGSADLLLAMSSMERCNMDEAWTDLALAAYHGFNGAVARVMEGLLWLYLDDPASALPAFKKALEQQPMGYLASVWYAETLRRMGVAADGLSLLESKRRKLQAGFLKDAILTRIHVDLGSSAAGEAAEDLLHRYPGEPEVVATAWYAARAATAKEHQSREGAASPGLARLERRFHDLTSQCSTPLEYLVPAGERSP